MSLTHIPSLLKHVTLAIWSGRHCSGSGEDKFLHALKIARGTLVRQGYLSGGSEEGPTDGISLTAAGHRRNSLHLSEAMGHSKDVQFDKLYKKVQLILEGSDTEDARGAVTSQQERATVLKSKSGKSKKYVSS